ncbi:hypothetical protein B0H66DRAFT_623263 [Apodospora peruviana]|uniref:Cell wall mannoprotein n=1 Tax=Apodospora peruviana TaxID=516989 RepID=A0AAE0I5S2_9PEZI|nr:hypothetical protein B0H66DRAFT_623263 [Apodospora peruviana]
MKYEAALAALVGVASAREINLYSRHVAKREVPQEHSHEPIVQAVNVALKLDNPLEIQDAIFALLGNKAAAEGAPNVDNLDCLQQIVADQAFTNSKAAGDVDGQINAILFRALERNTGSVGLASVLCNQVAVNPEIAAITQHQDPASAEGIAGNADIELAVAIQISLLGGDPTLALNSATFPPGELGDPTGAGNTCDDANDPAGCIFTLNLLTPAVDEAQILAAVAGQAGAGAGAAAAAGNAADAGAAACAAGAAAGAADVADAAGAADAADAAANVNVQAGATATVNIQIFTGDLGGPAPAVVSSAAERPFEVNGATFLNSGAALQRSCAIQKNACANAANSGQLEGGSQQCDAQEKACLAASAAKVRRFAKARRQASLDFGSCGSPAIQFAEGLDGRKEASFQNVNDADFNHGSALNIAIIADFTCQRLDSSCAAPADTVQACEGAAAAAKAATGQAAADAFNQALGA